MTLKIWLAINGVIDTMELNRGTREEEKVVGSEIQASRAVSTATMTQGGYKPVLEYLNPFLPCIVH